MAKANMNKLNTLHDMIADHMTEQLKQDEIEAKDIANILKFLKDNDITATEVESSPMLNLITQFEASKEDLEFELQARLDPK